MLPSNMNPEEQKFNFPVIQNRKARSKVSYPSKLIFSIWLHMAFCCQCLICKCLWCRLLIGGLSTLVRDQLTVTFFGEVALSVGLSSHRMLVLTTLPESHLPPRPVTAATSAEHTPTKSKPQTQELHLKVTVKSTWSQPHCCF